MRPERKNLGPVQYKAFSMASRGKESTRPAFPKLLSQQTKPFKSENSPAAFPSLPLLVEDQVPLLDGADQPRRRSSQSSNFDLEEIDQVSEEVTSQVSSTCVSSEATVTGSPSRTKTKNSLTNVSWASLELSSQHLIFVELRKQQPDAQQVAIALGLNHTEFEEIERAINTRKIYPASVDEIWNFCVALDGIGSAAMAPNTLDKFLGYLVFAGTYEEVTPEGLDATRKFLQQKGLDMVLSNAFLNHFRVPLSDTLQRSFSHDLQDDSDAALYTKYSQVYDVARTAYSDLPVNLKRRLSPRSHDEMIELLSKQTADANQSSRLVPHHQLVKHDIPPHTPIQNHRRVDSAPKLPQNSQSPPGLSLGTRAWSNYGANGISSYREIDQSPALLQIKKDQRPSSPMSLEIDHDTGRARIVGLSRRRESLKLSLAQGFTHHTLHEPSAFALHFICQGFPSDTRRTLLATDPRMLSATGFWLMYGNGEGQHLLPHPVNIATLRGGEYNPRTMILDYSDIQSQSLRALIQMHNDWVRAGTWSSVPPKPELLGYFERISVMTMENTRAQGDVGIGVQQSSEWIGLDSLADTSMYKDESTVVRSNWRAKPDQNRRYSPERPSFSPISEFGGTVPDWLLDDEA